jgi:molecular chaperone GrpE
LQGSISEAGGKIMTTKKEKNKEVEVEEMVEMPEDEVEEVSKEEEFSDAEALADKYLAGWKRCQADFENYKKRQADSQKDLLRYSTQNIIMQVIPVIDNFHASTDHIPVSQKENPWVIGIMYIQKQLEQVLIENGVTEIEVKAGDNFDPAMHEAVADMERKGCKTKDYKFSNKIKQVVTRGYQMGDKIIRASRVIVE